LTALTGLLRRKSAAGVDEASSLWQEAAASSEVANGARHVDTLLARNSLADVLAQQRRSGDALSLSLDLLPLLKRCFGAHHSLHIAALERAARLLRAAGRHIEAAAHLKDQLVARRALLGSGHRDVLVSTYRLASLLVGVGELDEAAEIMAGAMALARATLGKSHVMSLQFEFAELRIAHGRTEAGSEERDAARAQLGRVARQVTEAVTGEDGDHGRRGRVPQADDHPIVKEMRAVIHALEEETV